VRANKPRYIGAIALAVAALALAACGNGDATGNGPTPPTSLDIISTDPADLAPETGFIMVTEHYARHGEGAERIKRASDIYTTEHTVTTTRLGFDAGGDPVVFVTELHTGDGELINRAELVDGELVLLHDQLDAPVNVASEAPLSKLEQTREQLVQGGRLQAEALRSRDDVEELEEDGKLIFRYPIVVPRTSGGPDSYTIPYAMDLDLDSAYLQEVLDAETLQFRESLRYGVTPDGDEILLEHTRFNHFAVVPLEALQ
jgi:hypothetical protein